MLWDVEQYFKATKVPVAECVDLASAYKPDTKLWWYTRTIKATKEEGKRRRRERRKAEELPVKRRNSPMRGVREK